MILIGPPIEDYYGRSMGMDAVELLMSVEEEFGIQIPEFDAEKMQTVDGMYRYIVGELERRGDPRSEAAIWTTLTELIVEQLGVRSEDVTPNASFVEDLGVG